MMLKAEDCGPWLRPRLEREERNRVIREQREEADRLERLERAKADRDREIGERMAWWVLYGIPVPVSILSTLVLMAGGLPGILAVIAGLVLALAASFVSAFVMAVLEDPEGRRAVSRLMGTGAVLFAAYAILDRFVTIGGPEILMNLLTS